MDSEQFYKSVLDFLDDPEERDEVHDLLNWWKWCVFSIFFVDTPGSQIFASYMQRENGVMKL
jgi:hypothetical protein